MTSSISCVRDPEGGGFHALCVEREGKLIGLNLAERGLDDAQWRRIREGLDLSRLEALNLRGNLLTEVEGLEQMTRLRHLDLSHNQLTGLKMPDAPQLAHVFLKGNPALATPPPIATCLPEGTGQSLATEPAMNLLVLNV